MFRQGIDITLDFNEFGLGAKTQEHSGPTSGLVFSNHFQMIQGLCSAVDQVNQTQASCMQIMHSCSLQF